jgi:hypothetical protein
MRRNFRLYVYMYVVYYGTLLIEMPQCFESITYIIFNYLSVYICMCIYI